MTHRGNLKCTPDHLIHTRNRGWVPAQDLHKGDKLTGLNRMMSDETHVSVALTGTKYVSEHRFVAGYFEDIINKDVHHIDGNPFNNSYDNLKVISHSEHSKITNTGRYIDVVRDVKGRYAEKLVKAKRKSVNLRMGVGTNWTVLEVIWKDVPEDVYDITVPDVHNFVANRIIVHNCAEEPLPAGGSCNLCAINLAAFVKDVRFDFNDFSYVV